MAQTDKTCSTVRRTIHPPLREEREILPLNYEDEIAIVVNRISLVAEDSIARSKIWTTTNI